MTPPGCFDLQNGQITVLPNGGVPPFQYSVNGGVYQDSPDFTHLSEGTYTITTRDANDCLAEEIIWINVPLMVDVSLGEDLVIHFGDTTLIEAMVNLPVHALASISWSGLTNASCPTCLTQPVAPIITTTYTISVISQDGCVDEDSLIVFLEPRADLYIPNIFSPNGDQINDRLWIQTGPAVEEISSLVIFDRWGNLVFSAEHFLPGDESKTWDGTAKGQKLNSGVFAFRLVAKRFDGSNLIQYGNITLIK
jgi:gliding motility-associated-like protein